MCVKKLWVVLVAIVFMANGCGSGTHLESIQVLPLDPAMLSNNTVYVNPGNNVQYQLQGYLFSVMVLPKRI
jgi:hypothetical protein